MCPRAARSAGSAALTACSWLFTLTRTSRRTPRRARRVDVGQAAVEVEDADAVDQDVQAAEGVDGERPRPGRWRPRWWRHRLTRALPGSSAAQLCRHLPVDVSSTATCAPFAEKGSATARPIPIPRPRRERACRPASRSRLRLLRRRSRTERAADHARRTCRALPGQRLDLQRAQGHPLARLGRLDQQPCPLRVSIRLTRTSANSLAIVIGSPWRRLGQANGLPGTWVRAARWPRS